MVCADRTEGDLASLARQLGRDLDQIDDLTCHAVSLPAVKGAKAGVVFALTDFVLEVSRHAAVLLIAELAIAVLKSYFHREPRLKLTFALPDGTKLDVDAKNVDEIDAQRLAALLAAQKPKS